MRLYFNDPTTINGESTFYSSILRNYPKLAVSLLTGEDKRTLVCSKLDGIDNLVSKEYNYGDVVLTHQTGTVPNQLTNDFHFNGILSTTNTTLTNALRQFYNITAPNISKIKWCKTISSISK